jgi:hypothetical protein
MMQGQSEYATAVAGMYPQEAGVFIVGILVGFLERERLFILVMRLVSTVVN